MKKLEFIFYGGESLIIKFWEKKLTISGKLARVLGTILMVLIGTFLLYCAINPPTYFHFLKENINRIIYGVIGVLLILKALRMLFTNKLKNKS